MNLIINQIITIHQSISGIAYFYEIAWIDNHIIFY